MEPLLNNITKPQKRVVSLGIGPDQIIERQHGAHKTLNARLLGMSILESISADLNFPFRSGQIDYGVLSLNSKPPDNIALTDAGTIPVVWLETSIRGILQPNGNASTLETKQIAINTAQELIQHIKKVCGTASVAKRVDVVNIPNLTLKMDPLWADKLDPVFMLSPDGENLIKGVARSLSRYANKSPQEINAYFKRIRFIP